MILAKNAAGLRVLKDRSVKLTPRQRAMLVMVDGRRTQDDILVATAALSTTVSDINALFAEGLIVATPYGAAQTPADTAQDEHTALHRPRTAQERYADAYPIARRLTSELGLRGFRLNLAVEAANDLEALKLVAEKIRAVVGVRKFAALDHALGDENDHDFSSDFGEFDNTESSWLDE